MVKSSRISTKLMDEHGPFMDYLPIKHGAFPWCFSIDSTFGRLQIPTACGCNVERSVILKALWICFASSFLVNIIHNY